MSDLSPLNIIYAVGNVYDLQAQVGIRFGYDKCIDIFESKEAADKMKGAGCLEQVTLEIKGSLIWFYLRRHCL